MDKNTITGFVLIAAILFGFSFWQQKNNENEEAEKATTEKVEAAKTNDNTKVAANNSTDKQQAAPAEKVDSTALFFAAQQENAQKPVVLTNDKITAVISPKGGMVSKVELNNYKSYADYHNGKDAKLNLYNEKDAALNITLETKDKNLSLDNYYFTAQNVTANSVTMVLSDSTGATIALDYKLHDNLLDMDVRTEGMEGMFSTKTTTLGIDWRDKVAQHEKGYYFENMYSTLTYKENDGDTEKLREQGNEEETAEKPVKWVAFKNQYFSSCIIAKGGFANGAKFASQQQEEGSGYLKEYTAKLQANFDPSGKEATHLQFYFGPNHFRQLKALNDGNVTGEDIDLQDIVYLGWPVVRWINRFFTLYIFDFLTAAHLPMWLVLLLITLLLRVIVYGPTRKSFLSSAKMRVLRPKVEEINKKYPGQDNNMKRQQEMMMLYNQYGASPMGGCLPMLIQMPIWIAMFNFVPNAIEMRQQTFLWADDLSAYDDLISWSGSIWGLGNHLSLFCILFCATNLLYSYMSMRQQKDMMAGNPEQASQMKMMQWMMYLMPLMFFFMFNKYSAGLNYYYFISLLFSALTMWYLRHTTDDAKLLAKLEAYREKNKNNPKKSGGLAARLQALQDQQQKLLDEQRARNAAARNQQK